MDVLEQDEVRGSTATQRVGALGFDFDFVRIRTWSAGDAACADSGCQIAAAVPYLIAQLWARYGRAVTSADDREGTKKKNSGLDSMGSSSLFVLGTDRLCRDILLNLLAFQR